MAAKPGRALFALGLLLASVAGGVDALGWMTLGQVFTAHMSGNTVGLTVFLASANWSEVAKRVAVIADFLLGLAAGAVAATVAHRRRSRNGFVSALAMEAGLLVALLAVAEVLTHGARPHLLATRGYFLLLALPALAMGIQSATLRRVEPVHARTTYVTGVLTRLVENLVAWGALVWARQRDGRRPEEEAITKARVRVLASLWTAYAGGGVIAALLALRLEMRAYALPLALLIVAIFLDRGLAHAGVAAAGPEEG